MGDNVKVVVVFDGKCGFCQSNIAWLQRFDPKDTHLTYVPYQEVDLLKRLAPEADPERAHRELLVRTGDGKVAGGLDALRIVARLLWRMWFMLPLLYFPVLSSLLGPPVYRLIARNRRKIMGETEFCQIPARR